MRLVVEYGNEPGPKDKKVADWVFEEIESFPLENTDMVYLMDAYKKWTREGKLANSKTLQYHEDERVQKWAVNLFEPEHELSQRWNEKLGKTENLQEENKKLKIEIQDLKKQLTTSEMYRNPKKGGGVLRSPNAVKYAWIEEQQGLKEFNVDAMCEALDVNRSGYYAHKNSPLTSHQNEDERLSVLIIKSFNDSRQTYGTQRIQEDLREQGERVSRRRIARLMKKAGLICKTIKLSRRQQI